MVSAKRDKGFSFERGILTVDGFIKAEDLWQQLDDSDVDFGRVKEVVLMNMGGRSIPQIGLEAFYNLEKVTFKSGINNIPGLLFVSEIEYEDDNGEVKKDSFFKNLREVDCGSVENINPMAFWGSLIKKLVLHPENKDYRKIINSCPGLVQLKFDDGCVIEKQELSGAILEHINSIEFGDNCVVNNENFELLSHLSRVKFGDNCLIDCSFEACPKLKTVEIGNNCVVKSSFSNTANIEEIKLAESVKFEGMDSFVGKFRVDNDRERKVCIIDKYGRVIKSFTQSTRDSTYGSKEWPFPVYLKRLDTVKDSRRNMLGRPIYKDVIRYAIDREKYEKNK
ncbi:MAG: leucine-rich repeat protein [Clostridia bacterium]|nr:leucine-rich repeat protein [Clostridia bacterium]